MTGSTLVVSGVSAGYRRREVVHSVTLPPIEPGQLVALVGPNAAGKSTLLRAIAGLIKPSSGSVMLADTDLVRLPPPRLANLVAFMPQLLPSGVALTVMQSVIAALRSVPPAHLDGSSRSIRNAAAGVLDRLSIATLANEQLDRLSGGQRQLAGLAQVIVREPQVLLLDEPTSALDLRHQLEVMIVARSLADEGKIVIVVMHDLVLAARWADRIAVLAHGTVVAVGRPADTLSPRLLSDVYGIAARVEQCSHGTLQIVADAPNA